MSSMDSLGLTPPRFGRPDNNRIEHVLRLQALHRVLAFTGRTIDDVVNNPIAKNEVLGFYKLHKWIHRGIEISDLERQWNP